MLRLRHLALERAQRGGQTAHWRPCRRVALLKRHDHTVRDIRRLHKISSLRGSPRCRPLLRNATSTQESDPDPLSRPFSKVSSKSETSTHSPFSDATHTSHLQMSTAAFQGQNKRLVWLWQIFYFFILIQNFWKS